MRLKRETYHTYNGFLQAVLKDPAKFAKDNNRNSSQREGSSFSGTETFEEAYTQALNGYDSGLRQLELNSQTTQLNGTQVIFDTCGESLDVATYLNNVPECFISFHHKTSYDLPRLKLYINLTYTCGVDLDKAMNYTKHLIKLVNILQANNDVEILGIFGNDTRVDEKAINSKGTTPNTLDIVELKKAGETLVLNNIAAALHPSFFRRLWFKYTETQEQKFSSGYGCALSSEPLHKHITEKAQTYNDNYIFLPCLDNLNQSATILKQHVKTNLSDAKIKEILKDLNNN